MNSYLQSPVKSMMAEPLFIHIANTRVLQRFGHI